MDHIKRALKRQHDSAQELWLEIQLLRNLIIDSRWMTEQDLNLAIEQRKADPENLHQAEEHFAADEDAVARIYLADWLAELDSNFPPTG